MSIWNKNIIRQIHEEIMKSPYKNISIENLSNVLWSFSKAKIHDPKFVEFLFAATIGKISHIKKAKPADFVAISAILSAWNNLPEIDKKDEIFKKIMPELIKRVPEINTGYLATLLNTIARNNGDIRENKAKWMKIIIDDIIKRKVDDITTQNIYMICRSLKFARLTNIPNELISFIMKGLEIIIKNTLENHFDNQVITEAVNIFLSINSGELSEFQEKNLMRFLEIYQKQIPYLAKMNIVESISGLTKLYKKFEKNEKVRIRLKKLIMDNATFSAKFIKKLDKAGEYIIKNCLDSVKIQNTNMDIALKVNKVKTK